jgi:hypothetical protein
VLWRGRVCVSAHPGNDPWRKHDAPKAWLLVSSPFGLSVKTCTRPGWPSRFLASPVMSRYGLVKIVRQASVAQSENLRQRLLIPDRFSIIATRVLRIAQGAFADVAAEGLMTGPTL